MITPLAPGRVAALFVDEFPAYIAHDIGTWRTNYAEIVQAVAAASPDEFLSPAFQERLWDQNPISSVGPGISVTVKGAYADRSLANVLLELRDSRLTGTVVERGVQLQQACERILLLVKPHNSRRPVARTVRLMATLYPHDMCSILDARRVWEVSQLLGLPAYKHSHVAQHPALRDALRGILPPEPAATNVDQSIMLWFLWDRFCRASDAPGQEKLSHAVRTAPPLTLLPAVSQRRGLTFVGNNIALLVAMMRECENGLPRSGLASVVQQEAPQLKSDGSVTNTLSQAQGGLGLMRLENNVYYPTQTGLDLLKAPDPAIVLQPLLISRVFGIGHLLLDLSRHESGLAKRSLATTLSALFPGATSLWNGGALISWAVAAKLATLEGDQVRLTDDGEAYADALPADFETAWRLAIPVEIAPGSELPEDGPEKRASFRPALWSALKASFDAHTPALVLLPHVLPELHAALHATGRKRFALLAGLSGTGKTSIARAYAEAYCLALGLDPGPRYRQVAVRPDWTDPAGLLGYSANLESGTTFQPGEAVNLLLAADQDPSRPYFLCLDEMNLARVEHYFAPFLSAMEGSTGSLAFHTEDDAIGNVPPAIPWPTNLFIFGTVNMDESSHPFSDKVLDRAFTFEFWDVDLARWRDKRIGSVETVTLDQVYPVLAALYTALARGRRQFGYRVADEVLGFCSQDVGSETDALLDAAILSKVLPRVRGDDAGPLGTVLNELLSHLPANRFPRARAKVGVMQQGLEQTGQAKFWS